MPRHTHTPEAAHLEGRKIFCPLQRKENFPWGSTQLLHNRLSPPLQIRGSEPASHRPSTDACSTAVHVEPLSTSAFSLCLNICCYHQDLHPRWLQLYLHPRLPCSLRSVNALQARMIISCQYFTDMLFSQPGI